MYNDLKEGAYDKNFEVVSMGFSKIRPKTTWLIPILFFLITGGGVLTVPWLIPRLIAPRSYVAIGVGHASISAAIALHLFSVGNTIYSCGASFKNRELLETAYKVTTNGVIAAAGAGGLFLSVMFWIILPGEGSLNTVFTFLIALAGLVLFWCSLWRQSKYSRWYEKMYELIEEDKGGD